MSWKPQGAVLATLCELPQADRLALIVEQAGLSAHCDWGVDPVAVEGNEVFLWRYFSSVVRIHDPRTGVPAAGWWPASASVAGGVVARHAAYRAIHKRARCM